MPRFLSDTVCEPLTPEEKKWIRKLEKVFSECPSNRLGAYTIGDSELHFFDANSVELCPNGDVADGAAESAGIKLAEVNTPMPIEGVSG